MRHNLPGALLMLMLLAALGCQKSKEPPPARATETPPTSTSAISKETFDTIPAEPFAPAPTLSGLSAEDLRNLLAEQRARAEETNRELAATRDPDKIRQILLRRKGEVLKAQKTIRLSDQMTPAEKDSLLQPLELESVKISTQLMNAPR